MRLCQLYADETRSQLTGGIEGVWVSLLNVKLAFKTSMHGARLLTIIPPGASDAQRKAVYHAIASQLDAQPLLRIDVSSAQPGSPSGPPVIKHLLVKAVLLNQSGDGHAQDDVVCCVQNRCNVCTLPAALYHVVGADVDIAKRSMTSEFADVRYAND